MENWGRLWFVGHNSSSVSFDVHELQRQHAHSLELSPLNSYKGQLKTDNS